MCFPFMIATLAHFVEAAMACPEVNEEGIVPAVFAYGLVCADLYSAFRVLKLWKRAVSALVRVEQAMGGMLTLFYEALSTGRQKACEA